MARNIGPCLCGATDCPGYEVRRIWKNGRWTYVNPEDGEEVEEDFDDDREPLHADCDDDDYRRPT
jgi:hypothetical protein